MCLAHATPFIAPKGSNPYRSSSSVARALCSVSGHFCRQGECLVSLYSLTPLLFSSCSFSGKNGRCVKSAVLTNTLNSRTSFGYTFYAQTRLHELTTLPESYFPTTERPAFVAVTPRIHQACHMTSLLRRANCGPDAEIPSGNMLRVGTRKQQPLRCTCCTFRSCNSRRRTPRPTSKQKSQS